MPTDPGHEFADTVQQLCGLNVAHTPWQPYLDNFDSKDDTKRDFPITNAASSPTMRRRVSEITSGNPNLPNASQYGDIMLGFDTPNELPVHL